MADGGGTFVFSGPLARDPMKDGRLVECVRYIDDSSYAGRSLGMVIRTRTYYVRFLATEDKYLAWHLVENCPRPCLCQVPMNWAEGRATECQGINSENLAAFQSVTSPADAVWLDARACKDIETKLMFMRGLFTQEVVPKQLWLTPS